MNCKRKLIAWLLVCVMVFSLIPVSVFAAEEEHEHEYELVKIFREATCESMGVAKYACECGDYRYEQIEKHTRVTSIVKEATCAEDGVENTVCSVCGEVLEEKSLPATGKHSFDDKDVSATCTEPAKIGRICSVCGAVDGELFEYGAPLGHDEIETVTTPAACEKVGVMTVTCSRCDYEDEKEIPALGHTEVVDEAKAATCTETGLSSGAHCSACGETLVAQVIIPAAGHAYVKTEAYDDETGELIAVHTCSK